MNLSDWIEKYIGNDEYLKEQSKHPLDAVDHLINQWQGLTPRELKKYNLKRNTSNIIGTTNSSLGVGLDISSIQTSALCMYSEQVRKQMDTDNLCHHCPGAIANGKPCFAAFDSFRYRGDVKPMLKWLRKAKKNIERVSLNE